MGLSFFSPSRTVLLLSDEALFVYASGASGVNLLASVPWGAENFEQDVAKILQKNGKKNPVLILSDMVEQHYRKERVIKKGVGVMDRGNMLQRKLNFAFPNYPVRAYLQLKEPSSKGEKETSKGSDVFLFTAIPETQQFDKTLAAVRRSFVSVAAVCLLPVESAGLVQILSARLEAKKPQKSKWAIFMGQHPNGGLRQIVVKDGNIALTRMSPIPSKQENADVWSKDVAQEFLATMSYVSRFGYQPEDGLNVIVVASSGAGLALESQLEEKYDLNVLTPAQAAKIAGINLSRKGEEDSFAAALHVGWAGKKSKFTLPMKAPQVEKVSQPRQIATGLMVLMVGAALFLGYQVVSQTINLTELRGQVDNKNAQVTALQREYTQEVARKKALGFDVELMQSTISVSEGFDKSSVEYLQLIKVMGRALGRDLRIDQVRFELVSAEKPPAQSYGYGNQALSEEDASTFKVTMQMTYPGTADVNAGNLELEGLRSRLGESLSEYEVEITKRLKDYEYVEELTIETGDEVRSVEKQDYTVELVIKGPTG